MQPTNWPPVQDYDPDTPFCTQLSPWYSHQNLVDCQIPTAVQVKSSILVAVLVEYGRTLFPLDSSGNPVGILYSSSI